MHFIWVYGGTLLALICCANAYWRGGPVERYGATFILIAWFATPVVQKKDFIGFDLNIAIVDTLLFLALLGLSLWSRRIWTLFATAFQLGAVSAHVAAYFTQEKWSFSYLTITGIWGGIFLLIALTCGVAGHIKTQKAGIANNSDVS